jgi:hypothetical protein
MICLTHNNSDRPDYFSDGLTEKPIARLSLVSEIKLVSRWASMQHKGRGQDIHAVGAGLGDGPVAKFAPNHRLLNRPAGDVTCQGLPYLLEYVPPNV